MIQAPTYRLRWRSCIRRLVSCKGLGNGPDPPGIKSTEVFQRRLVVERRAARRGAIDDDEPLTLQHKPSVSGSRKITSLAEQDSAAEGKDGVEAELV